MRERLKILISAYACSPFKGSEPAVGWGFVSTLAKLHDLWVIVEQEKFRNDIESTLSANPGLRQSVHFFYLHKKRNRALRKIWPPSYYWYYRRWHMDAYHLASQLHAKVGFDLAHQLTMVGFREPGYLWKLGIPFVWGPVGGMGLFPWRFLPVIGGYGAMYYLGYNLFNWMHMNFFRRPGEAARAAASGTANGLLATNRENQEGAKKYWGCSSTVLPEVGLPREPAKEFRERSADEPLRLVWSGLHTPGKALNLVLMALKALPPELEWELHILGEGNRTKAWKILAGNLKISQSCTFHGWVPREKAQKIMQAAHVMIISSLRDLTSTVTIEALALGLPVICLNHCGFGDALNDTCAIKIPVTTPRGVISGIAGSVENLARDESRRRLLAKGALQQARSFIWKEKVQVVNNIYRAKVKKYTDNLYCA